MPERFFYAAWKRDHFVLLSHYTKKQNRTDSWEVDRAIRLLEDWINRKGKWTMTTWKDYKRSITSIDEGEMSISDTLSKLQVERIKRGISQKAFAE
mgnify:CR=1 FL=1